MKVKIIDYDHQGRGIAKNDGKVIFVPKVKKDTMVDIDIIASKKNYDIGISRNQKMKKPICCPHYFECGGCQLQHLTYDEQLEFKREKVENICRKYTNFSIIEPLPVIATSPFFYRNKVTLHIKGKIVGFYQEQTHQVFSLEYCPLLQPLMQEAIFAIKKFVSVHVGLEEVMIRLLDQQLMLDFKGKIDAQKLISFFGSLANSIYHNDYHIYGTKTLVKTIFDKKFLVSPTAFFQVNDIGLEKIYNQVIKYIRQNKAQNVLDLYCGTGTISLLVADYVKKVIGIEINEQAIINAKENAKLNHIKNVTFYAGTTASILPKIKDKIDTVIVDPPRSGLDKQTKKQILQILPNTIIYVSCDSITLARDLDFFYDFYDLKEICLVDEFPQTYHVETIVLLSSKSSDKFF